MNHTLDTMRPEEIEKRSFEIIEDELRRIWHKELPAEVKPIIMRAIHTSADFDYADNLVFSTDVVARAQEALRSGATIVTDTNMALAGINKMAMKQFSVEGFCFVSDPEIARIAKERGITRSSAAVDLAFEKFGENLIFVCGNAPTALLRLRELVSEERAKPRLVIGVPVGFVNVVQSKELLIQLGDSKEIPYIVARGRKGGSNIAASIVNALMYMMKE